MNTPSEPKRFSLDELCSLTDLPKRTVRYYIQIGLMDRPEGETKGAFYLASHLEQLVEIKRLTQAGVNLERIREVLEGAKAPVTPRALSPGDVTVKSHVHVAPGVELLIDPHTAGLSAQEVRHLIQSVVAAIAQTKQPSTKNSEET
jgi:DNA-binding transcriptional MerR regulator